MKYNNYLLREYEEVSLDLLRAQLVIFYALVRAIDFQFDVDHTSLKKRVYNEINYYTVYKLRYLFHVVEFLPFL